MAAEPIVEALSRIPHFRTLPTETIERVAAVSRLQTFEAGNTIFRAGSPADAFYVIRTGAVRLFRSAPDGKQRVVHNLAQGRSFAEAALLSIGHYPVHAEASESPTELVQVRGKGFLELFRSDEKLAAGMVGSLCMRLLELVERVDELAVTNAGARLGRYLMRLPSTGDADAPVVALPLAKKDLAAHLSMTPETLSRLLRRWQDHGLVESHRGSLIVRDPEALIAISEGAPA